VVHPKTKERTEIPEKMQLSFKVSNTIKEELKNL
jgi:nucleoid DNA-binding protein